MPSGVHDLLGAERDGDLNLWLRQAEGDARHQGRGHAMPSITNPLWENQSAGRLVAHGLDERANAHISDDIDRRTFT